ncbi:MAG: hypothetical protein ACE37J_11930 [Pikeienuella sp.]|uniref:hypothetical protein n=1 Tax=Pikeienuella sp. TaxID=2831957 RepID=UPI00391C380E
MILNETEIGAGTETPHGWKCRTCGSEDLLFDAYAEWDRENQVFTVQSLFDACECVACGGETKAVRFELAAEAGAP